MTTSPHLSQLTRAGQVILFACLGLLLLACGGESTAPVASASAVTATPTPIPTTAPLLLPPVDLDLPTLAALPTESASAEVPGVSAVDASSSNATPAEQTTNDAASSVPDTPAVATPADATEPEITTVASIDRWSDCVLQAADRTQSSVLLDPIAAGTSTDMNSTQLNTLAAASVACDLVSTGLAATDIGDYLSTASTCMNAWLASSGGGSVFVGLVSTSWDQTVPVWAQTHYVDALDSCFTGVSFAADVMSVVSADGSLTGAFDVTCLANSFDGSGTMRSFAQALANTPTAATISVSLGDAWVLRCADVGQMVAVAAAADGVTLSDSTISCIDSELKGAGVVSGLVAGTADTDAVGIATIACLTDSEASALLG